MKNSSDAPRIDKWLWAARFYKTRALAKLTVETGKVLYNGQKIKPSKTVEVGAQITVRSGHDTREVIVLKLSQRRGPATEAQTLYEETAQSIQVREKLAQQRQLERVDESRPQRRPSKKDRRLIKRFTEQSTFTCEMKKD
jgi:ribosome-associated heat shock protein Hsp15